VPRSYVLDTHACVFMLVSPRKLGPRARTAIEAVHGGRAEAWIPAAVVAEILLLRELGRVQIGLRELRDTMEDVPGLRFLPLDLPQLAEFAALGFLRDPFDRLIVSAARQLAAQLVTRDAAIEDAGVVETVWA